MTNKQDYLETTEREDPSGEVTLSVAKRNELIAASLRGLLGAIPLVGSAINEIVTFSIPNQRMERLEGLVELLRERLTNFDEATHALGNFAKHLATPEGMELFEEALDQTVRAVTHDRRRAIANLLTTGMAEIELNFDQSKKLFNLLHDLTDPELVLLLFHSRPNHFGSKWHQELTNKYPTILRPASKSASASTGEKERGALRENYIHTLARLGLLHAEKPSLTVLGRIFVRFIEDSSSHEVDT